MRQLLSLNQTPISPKQANKFERPRFLEVVSFYTASETRDN